MMLGAVSFSQIQQTDDIFPVPQILKVQFRKGSIFHQSTDMYLGYLIPPQRKRAYFYQAMQNDGAAMFCS